MSWNLFNRHSAPKKSVLSRTAEREFEKDVKQQEKLDEITRKLHKDMRRCVELRAASEKAEHKISEDLLLSSRGQNENKLVKKLENCEQAQEKLAHLMQEQNTCAQKTVVEPVKKLNSIFPSLQNAVRKREQSLQEYRKCQAKVEKYKERERTGQAIIKLQTCQKSLSFARDDFQNQNTALMEDMPKFYDGRIEYFQPSLQALIKSEVTYNEKALQVYSELSDSLQEHSGEGADVINTRIQQTLSNIRALSITVDD
ncbi:hypothetical protein ScPMuIL_000982 [Solemya velum]